MRSLSPVALSPAGCPSEQVGDRDVGRASRHLHVGHQCHQHLGHAAEGDLGLRLLLLVEQHRVGHTLGRVDQRHALDVGVGGRGT
jgi:hypothetical protein